MHTSELHYDIAIGSLHAHTFKVRCALPTSPNTQITFSLPSWTPGSYLIREFAQHVLEVNASSSGGQVRLSKTDKDTWTCVAPGNELEIQYDIYAFDSSIRAAFIDDSYAFFSGTSVFMRFLGRELARHHVTVRRPEHPSCQNFQLATSMQPTKIDDDGFGTYTCANYDEFVDHPMLMSEHHRLSFEVAGIPHQLVVTPKIAFDMDRLVNDCKRICSEHLSLFGTPAPFDRYLFLLRAEENGYGGLEHRASSALLCKITDLPLAGHKTQTDGYRDLLGLVSHEYFHAWNIKQLKPEPFRNFDYNRENYTDLLWFFEGFTSYYDDLAVCRSKAISVENYLDGLASTISRVYSQAGRFKQTLAEASFDAWIKFYRPNENASNAQVSYYQKGNLVALALDLTIRAKSQHTNSVDDVMRGLWKNFGSSQGVTEEHIVTEASLAAGSDLRDFFETYIHSTEDLNLQELLERFGIDLKWSQRHVDDDLFDAYLGCSIKTEGTACVVTTVAADSPAMYAGLNAGDVILALNNYRVNASNFDSQLSRNRSGDEISIHAFRRGWLKHFTAKLTKSPQTKCTLEKRDKLTREQTLALNAWLHL